MPVTVRVVGGGTRDAVAGQPLRNRVDAEPGQELREDPLDHRCGVLIDRQGVQTLAVSGLGRVRVGPGLNEPVSVGRPSAQVTAFHLCVGCQN